MSPFEKKRACGDGVPLLVFYVCEEITDSERKLIETHLANCKACSEHRSVNSIAMSDFQKGNLPPILSGLSVSAKLKGTLSVVAPWPAAVRPAFNVAVDGLITGQVTVDQALAITAEPLMS